MRPILMPDRAKALSADCAPGPGVLVLFPPVARSLMWTALMPSSCNIGKPTIYKLFKYLAGEGVYKWPVKAVTAKLLVSLRPG